VSVGSQPWSVAVNPVTNKIYVAFHGAVTVIDGATNTPLPILSAVNAGSFPVSAAVNPVTNKIYVTNGNSSSITVIDGASNSTATINVGSAPESVAVNPLTNKIYVANQGSANVTVVDGATNSTVTVSAGTYPAFVAVNPVTNKIYVANSGSNTVTVIDGATNSTTTVSAGTAPVAVTVNPVTNKIYVTNGNGANVTVIDGASNSTTTVNVGSAPECVAVNSVTNKIYVAGENSANVTVIDGASNSTTTVSVGSTPESVAVNPVTNKIYVANYFSSSVTVIDGGTNSTLTLRAGTYTRSVAVNPVTNKVYAVNQGSGSITVIDGATYAAAAVSAGTTPHSVAVNPVTNKAYIANLNSNNVTVIDGATNSTAMVTVGTAPVAVAVNTVTNKIYVANENSNNVTVIDGATNSTATVGVGTYPGFVAVNPVTNKIYVANEVSANVTVIDGATNSTVTVSVGSDPWTLAINPVTNKIYVANADSGNVTVVDGATNSTATVNAGNQPEYVAVNPVTNKIYVANSLSDNVTVIDGATNAAVAVSTGIGPNYVAVNPVSNKIYVVCGYANITVIDGATNSTATVDVGTRPSYAAVDPTTNKIYVSMYYDGTVEVIDGATGQFTIVGAGAGPYSAAVNPVTNKIYVTNPSGANVTVITEQTAQAIPLTATIAALPNNLTTSATPSFTFSGQSTFSPNAPAVADVLYQVDTWQGVWSHSAPSFTGTTSALQPGVHILYAYAADSQLATSTQAGSPLIGNIAAYLFLENPSAVVLPPLQIATTSLADAVSGQAYNASLSATGGGGYYVWAASGLPLGFSTSGSTISSYGTPAAAPSGATPYNISVTVTDNLGNQASAILSLVVTGSTGPTSLTLVNPYASRIINGNINLVVGPGEALTAHGVTSIAADGASAVLLVFHSPDPNTAVTFAVSASGVASFGTVTAFDANYLTNLNQGSSTMVKVNSSGLTDSAGNSVFLALLWAPAQVPTTAGTVSGTVPLTITATQGSSKPQSATLSLQPPPLLLVHGIWGNLSAWIDFKWWLLQQNYPHSLIFLMDYSAYNDLAFDSSQIQGAFRTLEQTALTSAAERGMAARSVDVVAHSMGGLVTRYFIAYPPSGTSLPANSVHLLITVGTPHQGTPLATTLDANVTTSNQLAFPSWIGDLCSLKKISPCALGTFFSAYLQRRIDTGTMAMEPRSSDLALLPATSYRAIIGQAPVFQTAPTPSPFSDYAEGQLNYLVSAFVSPPSPPQTISGIMQTIDHDTIVPVASQQGSDPNAVTVTGIVHANLGSADIAETESPDVWNQALFWLLGGTGAAPMLSQDGRLTAGVEPRPGAISRPPSATGSSTITDLTGYTQIDPSNASFSPPSGSAIPINSATSITATSSTKSIIQFVMLQQVADAADALSLYATQAPFSVPFTPIRLGTASFGAFVIFSDMTYTVTSLTYQLTLNGAPSAVSLNGAPAGSVAVGTTAQASVTATFPSGTVDVTQAATYQTLSGNSAVFSFSSSGVITATGPGTDWLEATYGGITASAQIIVGTCTYALSPQQQTVPSGGSATISVTVPTGCSWALSSSANWLATSSPSGSGSGTVSFTTAPNTTGNVQAAYVQLGDQTAAAVELGSGCTYSASLAQINAPAGGTTGTVGVSSSCSLVVSSDSSWLVPTLANSATVGYSVPANPNTSSRSGTLTVGTQAIPVSQLASNAYAVGDVYPSTANTVASFGDGSLNTLDLIAILRAVTDIGPVPANCSDLFDAMDAYPLDTATTRGGDGLLNTLDLIEELRRITNIDSTRPVRTSPKPGCTSSEQAEARSITRSPKGTLELAPSGLTGDGWQQTAILLSATADLDLAGLALSVTSGPSLQMRFVASDRPPSVSDTGVEGSIGLAWLNGSSVRAGQRVLLGYVDAPPGSSLAIRAVSANAASDGSEIVLSFRPRL
jgi:YVTN family beta-propeller protein